MLSSWSNIVHQKFTDCKVSNTSLKDIGFNIISVLQISY